MRIRTPYFLYIIGLLSLQPLVCILNTTAEQSGGHSEAIATFLNKIKEEKADTYYNQVAQAPIYKQYKQKQAALDLSALAGVGYGINILLKKYAPACEHILSDYQHSLTYGPDIVSILSRNPWIYPACAAGLTAALGFNYLRNYRKHGHSLDERTREFVEPFENERLRSLELVSSSLGMAYDSHVIKKEDNIILDKCIDLARKSIYSTITELHDINIAKKTSELSESLEDEVKDRIQALKDKIEVHLKPHTDESQTAATMINPQRILAGTLLLGALGGNGSEIRSVATFNDIPAYIPPLAFPSYSVIYGFAYAAYSKLSEWNHRTMYKKIAYLLNKKAEDNTQQAIDVLTEAGITEITETQQKNREQGYLIELLGQNLHKWLVSFKKIDKNSKKDSLTKEQIMEILRMTESVVDNLFP